MSKSIMQNKNEECCYICELFKRAPHPPGIWYDSLGNAHPVLEEHHVFDGIYRQASEDYGLKVYLCRYHHTGDMFTNKGAVHTHPNEGADLWLKQQAQLRWESRYSKELPETEEAHEEFREVFGKSYL